MEMCFQSSHRTFKFGVHFFSLYWNSNFLKRSDHSRCRSTDEGRPILFLRGGIATTIHDVESGWLESDLKKGDFSGLAML